jgi:large subunit ribosomal protein L29
MPSIKISDLRQKKDDELKKQLDDLNKEKFNLRFQASNGQLSNTGRVKEGENPKIR